MSSVLSEITHDFLGCETPASWLAAALENIPTLLIDHAHCEKKAASTALNLMFRYVDRRELLTKLAQLAREEMLHFEQVLELMDQYEVSYDHMTPARYAMGLRKHIRQAEPHRLIDTLVIGAFIEARSCERFNSLVPHLVGKPATEAIGKYYQFLLKSESRHYQDYLCLAQDYADEPINERIGFFRAIEKSLILEPDSEFRFHSGVPA